MVNALHSVRSWLPITQYWLHVRLKYLPDNVASQVVCQRTANLEEFPIIKIHSHTGRSSDFKTTRRIINKLSGRNYRKYKSSLFNKLHPDLVHSHFADIAWEDALLPARSGIPHVTNFYGYDVDMLPRTDPIWGERYLELFDATDRVICEGPYMAKSIEALGCPPEKITVLRLGVEIDKIAFEPRALRQGEPLCILIVGAFKEKKGIPTALRAAALATEEIPVRVSIIGDATDEPRSIEEKEKIMAATADHRLEGAITFLGFRSHKEMMSEATRSHVLLAPSKVASDGDCEGGAPVTLIDMAASGIPIVSTRHCDIPDVVVDDANALLAEEEDVQALAEHLIWWYRNPAEWISLLQQGRQHVEQHFSATRQSAELARIYQDVLER